MNKWGIKLVLPILLMALVLTSIPFTAIANSNQINTLTSGDGCKLLIKNYSNPIQVSEIEAVRTSTTDDYNLSISETNYKISLPRIKSTPEIPQGAALVAYGYVVGNDGTPDEYIGMAGNATSVDIIRTQALQWYENKLSQHNNLAYQYEARGPNWQLIYSGNANLYEDPYGGITNNYEVQYLAEDNNSTYDWFAVKQIFALEPGIACYSSNYINKNGWPSQDWGWGTVESGIHDWDPLGSISGSQQVGVTISTSGVGLTWSYTQPNVTTTDYTSTLTNKASWTETWSSDDDGMSTGGMKPGSICQTYQQSSGSYNLCRIQADGQFKYYGLWMTHTNSCIVDFSVQY